MVTDAMVSTDCEIEDLNLMDRDYREFGDRIIYFIDTTEMGPGNGDPTVSALQKCFPRIPGGGTSEFSLHQGKYISGGSISL